MYNTTIKYNTTYKLRITYKTNQNAINTSNQKKIL